MIALLLATATASNEAHDTAILVNPHGPILALVGNALGLRSLDMNLRSHRVFTPRLGITAQIDASTATLSFFRSTHLGVRVGPRFALRKRGLNDWALSPFAVVGVTTLSSRTNGRLARWAVLGAGVEGGANLGLAPCRLRAWPGPLRHRQCRLHLTRRGARGSEAPEATAPLPRAQWEHRLCVVAPSS